MLFQLEMIASKLVKHVTQLPAAMSCSFLAIEVSFLLASHVFALMLMWMWMLQNRSYSDSLLQPVLQYLFDTECVAPTPIQARVPDESTVETLQATGLGLAIFHSGLCPEEGLAVFDSLKLASKCFIAEHPLHALYLITPVYGLINCQWTAALEHLTSSALGNKEVVSRMLHLIGFQVRLPACVCLGCATTAWLAFLQPNMLRACINTRKPPEIGDRFFRTCSVCGKVLPNVAENCALGVAAPHADSKVKCGPFELPVHESVVQHQDILLHSRLFAALLLFWTLQTSVGHTAAKFGIDLTTLQQLRKNAYSFAGRFVKLGVHVSHSFTSTLYDYTGAVD